MVGEIDQQAWDEYIANLRKMYKVPRFFGLLLCILGVILFLAAEKMALPIYLQHIGLGLIGFGWAIFAFVIVKRSRWASKNRPKF